MAGGTVRGAALVCLISFYCVAVTSVPQTQDPDEFAPAKGISAKSAVVEDGELEEGEVPVMEFPKSLNDFYKGKWTAVNATSKPKHYKRNTGHVVFQVRPVVLGCARSSSPAYPLHPPRSLCYRDREPLFGLFLAASTDPHLLEQLITRAHAREIQRIQVPKDGKEDKDKPLIDQSEKPLSGVQALVEMAKGRNSSAEEGKDGSKELILVEEVDMVQ
eukprot:2965107-Rhodomonas_salina.1